MNGEGNGSEGDTISYATLQGPFTVRLSDNFPGDGGSMSNFENITGSLGNDTLTGSDLDIGVTGNNRLDGFGGLDDISGGTGNDDIRIYGHTDLSSTSITINGGDGSDTIRYLDSVKTAASTYVHEVVSSLSGIAQVKIGTAIVARYQSAEAFTLNSFGASDTITMTSTLAATDYQVNGGSGEDTINVPSQDTGDAIIVDTGDGLDTLNVNPGGLGTQKVILNSSQDFRLLHIYAGGALELLAGSDKLLTFRNENSSGVGSAAITIDSGGKLDLADNSLIAYGYTATTGPLALVEGLIASGRNGGAWDGSGIISSTADNNSAHNTTIGVMTASQFGATFDTGSGADTAPAFEGVRLRLVNGSATLNVALVRYTYYGDADFNGAVNFDDYARIDAGFTNNRTGWLNGDFDLNNAVNFDDYALIDLAYNTQSGTLFSGGPGGGNPNLVVIAQMPHFTQTYMWFFIDWNIDNHGIYYTPEDFFPDGEPW